jgi:pilus assembly protein Flp/PilA
MFNSIYNAIHYFFLMLKSKAVPLSLTKKSGHGQGLVEYALILVLVAVVVIVVLSFLGPEINYVYVKIACKFDPSVTAINFKTGETITCSDMWGETPPSP